MLTVEELITSIVLVDSAAAEGALKGCGSTYAVLGTGVRVCYPKENYRLFERLCSGEGGGGIPVDQDHVRLFFFKDQTERGKNTGGNIEEGLLRLHHGQIIVRLHVKDFQHAVEHLPVLAGYAHDGPDSRPGFQLVHQRTHLNRFGPCAKDHHYSLHPSVQ